VEELEEFVDDEGYRESGLWQLGTGMCGCSTGGGLMGNNVCRGDLYGK